MSQRPRFGEAFSFNAPGGLLRLMVESTSGDTVTVRFLDDCRTKADIPQHAFTLARSTQINYVDGSRDPMFLVGPGAPLSREEVSAYLKARQRELEEASDAAARQLHDFTVDSREVDLKLQHAPA